MSNSLHKKPVLSASFENSSNIKSAEYDPFMKVLSLTFQKGGEYDYLEVSENVFHEMKKADSAGRFFHTKIRGKYEFHKKGSKKPVKEEKATLANEEAKQESL
jgi:hypothetical protein